MTVKRHVICLAFVGVLSLSAAAAETETHTYRSIDGIDLTLDLHRPVSSNAPTPVVVYVHGGGWRNGDRTRVERHLLWLIEHGFAVASIDFRQTDVAQWPAQIDDCYAAVRWVREHGSELGLATEKIGIAGSSSGAHLVSLVGTRPNPEPEEVSSKIQAVLDIYGPTNLLTMPPNNIGNGRTAEDVANSNGAKLLGATVREVPELAKDASALYQVSGDDPPFLIVHGEADEGVPVTQSQHLYAALVATGIDAELVVLPGAGHGGPEFKTPAVHDIIVRFFDRTLR